MAYATPADMVARFGEVEIIRLSAPDGDLAGEGNRAKVALALADATVQIDSYIARRYVTPLSPVPPVVVAHCCALARYALAQGEGRAPTEQMRDAHKDSLAWLASVAKGDAALPDVDPISASSSFAKAQDRPPMVVPRDRDGLY